IHVPCEAIDTTALFSSVGAPSLLHRSSRHVPDQTYSRELGTTAESPGFGVPTLRSAAGWHGTLRTKPHNGRGPASTMIMLLFGLVADTSFGLWPTPRQSSIVGPFPSRQRRAVDRELTGRPVQPGMRPLPRFDRYLIARW